MTTDGPLHRKFDVRRTDGTDAPGCKHEGCDYFVLDLTHDPHAIPAVIAYADAVQTTHPVLAADIRRRWGTAEPAATIPDELPEALGSEDGEHWWLQGHVPPAVAVLSVLVDTITNVDAGEAASLLVGDGEWHTFRTAAANLVKSVRHRWAVTDDGDDEVWHTADASTPGAEPWTEVRR